METEIPTVTDGPIVQIIQILESYRDPKKYQELRARLGGWEVVESDTFPNSLRVVTTRGERKLERRDSISVHYDPGRGRFYKIAENPQENGKIGKEFRCWETAIEVFAPNEKVQLKKLSIGTNKSKSDYIDMPNMGMPLIYFEKLFPGIIPEEEIKEFVRKTRDLITTHHLCHKDPNPGNILVRYEGGIRLFPIDWETSRTLGKNTNPLKYDKILFHSLSGTFRTYYPDLSLNI